MSKVFRDPALITAQIGGTRAGSILTVEDEAAH